MESWREELYHHGIQGQKWGDRNGPPYPLTEKQYSSVEKRLNKIDRLEEKVKKYRRKDQDRMLKVVRGQNRLSRAQRFGLDGNIDKRNKEIYKAQKSVLKTIDMDRKIIDIFHKIEKTYEKYGQEIPPEYLDKGKSFAQDILARNIELRGLEAYKIGNSIDSVSKEMRKVDIDYRFNAKHR